MPPTYSVRAAVIDIRTDTPQPTDRFLVDTNVWGWAYYPSSRYTPSGSPVVQASDYSPYLQLTRVNGASRYRTVASLAELAHLIEQVEHTIYTAAVASVSLKEYRHNVPAERVRVVRLIEQVWALITADSELLTATHDDALAATALARIASAPVDGYDVLLLEAMAAAGVTEVLSDDGDFCCVADIEVYTANQRALAAARAQGRLVVR
jgi:hypothetical protein